MTKEMAEFWGLDISGGIIVNEILKNSPAEKSGLAVGDIIFEVNGEPVTVDREENLSIFQRRIAELGPRASVEFSILRRQDDKIVKLSLPAVLDEAPMAATDAPEYESVSLEFKVRNLVFGDYMRFNQDPDSFRGVIVSELEPGGLADVGGLQFGDIIQRVGDKPTASVEDFETVMQNLEQAKSSEVIFFIWRNKKTLFINIKTDWN
jgi:S1-C subfamily serine protease